VRLSRLFLLLALFLFVGLALADDFRFRSGAFLGRCNFLFLFGTSHANAAVAAALPRSWATTKPGTSMGRIPANVLLAARASVTAGFANEVDDVNQYADVM